jgi:hypothetical protein
MRLRHACLLLAVSAVLPACARPESVCTLEARAAVQVTVVDTRGGIQRDARVTFTVDGGPEEQALCNGSTPSGGQCDRWVTSYERAGEYVITATSADGTRTARTQVRVGEDECHVKTESVQLTLPD